MDKLVDNKMINKIEKLLQEARTHVAVEVNNTLLRTYMEIGNCLLKILICMKMKRIIKTKQFLCSQKNLSENLVKVFHVPIFGI